VLWAVAVVWGGVAMAELPRVGDILPAFTLPAPGSAEDRAALGPTANPAFGLGDVDGQCLRFEVSGGYCVWLGYHSGAAHEGLGGAWARGGDWRPPGRGRAGDAESLDHTATSMASSRSSGTGMPSSTRAAV